MRVIVHLEGAKGQTEGLTHTHTRRNLEEVLQRLGMCLSRIYLMDDWITLWQLRCCGTRGSCVQHEDLVVSASRGSSRPERRDQTYIRLTLTPQSVQKKLLELGDEVLSSHRQMCGDSTSRPLLMLFNKRICGDKSHTWRVKYISFVERKDFCAWKKKYEYQFLTVCPLKYLLL